MADPMLTALGSQLPVSPLHFKPVLHPPAPPKVCSSILTSLPPLPTPPPPTRAALADQKFVVLGAGSAGMGVVSMIAQGEPRG